MWKRFDALSRGAGAACPPLGMYYCNLTSLCDLFGDAIGAIGSNGLLEVVHEFERQAKREAVFNETDGDIVKLAYAGFLAAGGATEFASLNRTKLFRRAMPTASSGEPADEGEGEKADKPESGAQTMRVRLEDIIEDGDLSTNYSLRPGDIVTVPQQVF